MGNPEPCRPLSRLGGQKQFLLKHGPLRKHLAGQHTRVHGLRGLQMLLPPATRVVGAAGGQRGPAATSQRLAGSGWTVLLAGEVPSWGPVTPGRGQTLPWAGHHHVGGARHSCGRGQPLYGRSHRSLGGTSQSWRGQAFTWAGSVTVWAGPGIPVGGASHLMGGAAIPWAVQSPCGQDHHPMG